MVENKFNDNFLNIQNKKYHSDYSFVFNENIGIYIVNC